MSNTDEQERVQVMLRAWLRPGEMPELKKVAIDRDIPLAELVGDFLHEGLARAGKEKA